MVDVILAAQIPNARIGIIDANTPPTLGSVQNREDIDLRVFAINPASQKFLQSKEERISRTT